MKYNKLLYELRHNLWSAINNFLPSLNKCCLDIRQAAAFEFSSRTALQYFAPWWTWWITARLNFLNVELSLCSLWPPSYTLFLSFCEGWWNRYLQHLQRSICRWKLQNEACGTWSSVHGMYADTCSDVRDTVGSGRGLFYFDFILIKMLNFLQSFCISCIILFKIISWLRFD